MNCPVCRGDSRVIDTEANRRRRRECVRCGHRWSTVELDVQEVERLKGIERAAATIRDLLPQA